jgi:hypothetical protein
VISTRRISVLLLLLSDHDECRACVARKWRSWP